MVANRHTSYLSVLVHHRIIWPVKVHHKMRKIATKQSNWAKIGPNRPKFCVLYATKYTGLKKSKLLLVVAAMTNMSYGRSLTSNVIERRSNQYWLVLCYCVLSKCVYNRTWHFFQQQEVSIPVATFLVEKYIVTNLCLHLFVFLVCRFWGIPLQNHNQNIQRMRE